jgi:hypothetical protein
LSKNCQKVVTKSCQNVVKKKNRESTKNGDFVASGAQHRPNHRTKIGKTIGQKEETTKKGG